jgi:hypothetical protein
MKTIRNRWTSHCCTPQPASTESQNLIRHPFHSLALPKANNQPSSQRTKETVESLRCARQDERTRSADGTIGLFILSIVWLQRLLRTTVLSPALPAAVQIQKLLSFPSLSRGLILPISKKSNRSIPTTGLPWKISSKRQQLHKPCTILDGRNTE